MGIYDGAKEVRFDLYCEKCTHCEEKEDSDFCSECLSEPMNIYSHKPVKFEETNS